MGRAIDFRDHTRMEKHQTMRAKFAEWFFYGWILVVDVRHGDVRHGRDNVRWRDGLPPSGDRSV